MDAGSKRLLGIWYIIAYPHIIGIPFAWCLLHMCKKKVGWLNHGSFSCCHHKKQSDGVTGTSHWKCGKFIFGLRERGAGHRRRGGS